MLGSARRMPRARGAATAPILLTVAGAVRPSWTALASRAVEVAQKGRAFAAQSVHIARGSGVRFANEDNLPHQIYVKGHGVNAASPPRIRGQVIDVAFPQAGAFEVQCGVHPGMRRDVRVQ